MNREQFLVYLDDYNSGDPSRYARHLAPDIIFENFGDYHRGPDVLAFLKYVHEVVHTSMTVRNLLVDGEMLALDADTHIEAKMDLPNMPIGSLIKGEKTIARTFVIYETRGPLIHHILIAGWPPKKVP
jgi:hypothetical protein